MTDRELLEMAAKAIGLDAEWAIDHWNPLAEDGDALRLAVKLRLDLLFDGFHIAAPVIEVTANTEDKASPFAMETLDSGDPYAATRRAIVRAAAAMAKTT